MLILARQPGVVHHCQKGFEREDASRSQRRRLRQDVLSDAPVSPHTVARYAHRVNPSPAMSARLSVTISHRGKRVSWLGSSRRMATARNPVTGAPSKEGTPEGGLRPTAIFMVRACRKTLLLGMFGTSTLGRFRSSDRAYGLAWRSGPGCLLTLWIELASLKFTRCIPPTFARI